MADTREQAAQEVIKTVLMALDEDSRARTLAWLEEWSYARRHVKADRALAKAAALSSQLRATLPQAKGKRFMDTPFAQSLLNRLDAKMDEVRPYTDEDNARDQRLMHEECMRFLYGERNT